MRRALHLLALIVAVASAHPAPAAAQDNSAIDEYVENVPGAEGDEPTGPRGERPNDRPIPLPPEREQLLDDAGPEGSAAAAVAEATAPSTSSTATAQAQAQAQARGSAVGGDASEPAPAVTEVVGGFIGGDHAGGLGVAFPIILVITLLGAAAAAFIRRQRRRHATS